MIQLVLKYQDLLYFEKNNLVEQQQFTPKSHPRRYRLTPRGRELDRMFRDIKFV